jgi:branched-chain amino acid transport system ATP-binding protein
VTPPLLDVRGLCTGYGVVQVLEDVSVRVEAGEIVSLIGPNGAGKSTVLRSVAGLLPPWRGAVAFGGCDLAGRPPHLLPRDGLVFVPQGRVVFPQMTVRENLDMGAYLFRRDRARVRDAMGWVLDLFPRLRERLGQLAGTLSGGEQQMCAIARGLMARPRLLLLDEPSLGLAPRFIDLVFEKMDALRAAGVAVLLVEQNAVRALEIADRAYVLARGSTFCEGTGRQLLEDEQVQVLFLGGRRGEGWS